ncbi:MATE family efflux transporter [Phytohalomonas tamaricis]|uniref:MATE family efflux transporter n=1 Tax=Phytohalomonas tamaricis TaxID=2081032 RepID=UPI000D0B9E1D|nr:MATE family efflux transporter [Phytohalomonas tamaricis]
MGRTLWQQTWPMAMGVMALLGFNLVDSIFVARLGTQPLAAQSFTFPVTFIIIGVQVGMGIAIAATISRALGAGEHERARRLGSLILCGGGVIMALLMVVLWLVQGPVFAAMGAGDDILAVIRTYWWPWLLASWMGAMLYFGYSLFRAHGEARFPGIIMIVTSLLNLVLDPLLIFGIGPFPGLGLPGAAWATLIAFTGGILLVGMKLGRQDWLSFHHLGEEARRSSGPFLHIAGPAMVSQLMPPASALLATSVVARLGNAAVASWGLASRLETFVLLVVLALTMSLPPWLGRNYGAGKWRETRQLMNLAVRVVLIWQFMLGVVVAVLAAPIAGLMTGDDAVRDSLTTLMRFLLPSYAFLGICMLVVSASNALGWPMKAMLISFLRLFACYLPCLWIGSLVGGLTGLAAGAALGNVLAGIMAWRLYRHSLGERGKSSEGEVALEPVK